MTEEEFRALVRDMRAKQKRWFATHIGLAECKAAERAVDEALDPPAIQTPDPNTPIQGELL